MSYKVETTANFEKEAKKLIKKYRSLQQEIDELIDELEINPTKGVSLGNNIYKIRLAVKSKGKGKRGGARVITKVIIIKHTVYMFSIYIKGQKDDISKKEIEEMLREIP